VRCGGRDYPRASPPAIQSIAFQATLETLRLCVRTKEVPGVEEIKKKLGELNLMTDIRSKG
jgi:hypothetical protein